MCPTQTVLSEILMFALNRLFAPVGTGSEDTGADADISCVFAFDAYHYPNAYLGEPHQHSFRNRETN
jgi:hypothetical protein